MATQAKPTLAQRIKDTAGPAPSLVPAKMQEVPPPPDKVEEVVPHVNEFVTDKKDLLALRRMMNRHMELATLIKPLDKERDSLTTQIKALAGKYKIGKAQYDGDSINYFSGTRSTIKADLLLSQGVQPAVITAATILNTSYTLKITPAKEE